MSNIKKISDTVKRQFFTTIAYLVIPLSLFLILRPIIDYNQETKEYREDYLTNIEIQLSERVNQTISHLTLHQNELANTLSNQALKDYVYFAHSVAMHLYNTNLTSITEPELKQLICETLRNLRFNDGRGYYFVGDFEGNLILHSDRPALEGENLFDYQDSRGNFVFRDFITIAQSQPGENYSSYTWTMPDSSEGSYDKTSFIKLFEPFNWYIGTGEYSTSVLQLLQADAVNWIAAQSSSEEQEGFVFAFELGGEPVVQVNSINPDENQWNHQDAEGIYVYRELQQIAMEGGGTLIYRCNNHSSGELTPKLTYAALFEPWDWVIASGVYLDGMKPVLDAKFSELKETLLIRAAILALLMVLVVLLTIRKTSSFSNQINNEFEVFLHYFRKAQAKDSSELIDKQELHFQEFYHLADIANEMVLNTISMNSMLQKNHQQLQLIMEGSRIGWWDWDITTGSEFYNIVLPELLGYSLNEIKPHIDWWQSKIHPDDATQLGIDLDLHFNGKTEFFTNKHRLKTKTGEWKWFFDHGKVVEWNDSGEPIRMLGTLQDIDKQQKLLIKLQESEELYRLLADNTGDMIWITDLEMNITYISPAAEDLLGYSVKQLLGTSVRSLVGKDTFKHIQKIQEQRFIFGQNADPVLFTVNATHKNGYPVPLEVKARFLYDEKGEPYALQGTSRDISERSTLEKELQQSQKMEAVGQLAGGIAHDFNNLLQAINGNAEMVLMKLEASSPAYSSIQEISSAGKKASVLVQQILAFSRRQVLTIETINLNIVIKGFLPMLKGLLTENISLTFTPQKDLWLIDADTGQVEQVILNLAINARDAMPASGGSILVKTQNTILGRDFSKIVPNLQSGDYVEFTITDNGTGMDEATKNSCFEPFFTTKDVDKGTGLGLATVYGLVKQHNGYITVDSVLGEGTTFSIYIPASKEGEIKNKKNTTASIKGGRELILLADDDPGVLNIAKEFLVHAGYSVITATDGEDAVDQFNNYKEKIDLFLLDVMMPKLGGYDVYKNIKAKKPEAKFLFASGYSKKAVHNNFILEDGLSLVQKPYKFAEFLKAVRDILDSK